MAEEPPFESLAWSEENWTVERTVDDRENVAEGDSVVFERELTTDDAESFATATGDTNRLHYDAEYADGTRFGEPILPGMHVASLVSAALARFPGTTVYLNQTLEFSKPAPVGGRFVATCEVVEELDGGRFRVDTTVAVDDERVISGEATILLDPAPGR